MRRGAAVLAAVLALAALVGCEDHRDPVSQAVGWFPASEQANARCIVARESGGDPRAVSSTNDYGLFQINAVHRRAFESLTGRAWIPAVFDPRLNGQYARVLQKSSGWRPWATARGCGLR